MEKVIRNGFVAVLYSPDFGAGWSTWANEYAHQVLFDPKIVEMVERADPITKIEEYCAKEYPDMYTGGSVDLTIAWLPVGTEFRIREYDGSESIEIKDEVNWIVA